MKRKENPFVQYIVLFILLSVAYFYSAILSMLMPENKRSTQKKKEQKLSTVLILPFYNETWKMPKALIFILF